MPYRLRVTLPSYPETTRRNISEGNILVHILDHLAAKPYGHAADIAAQRYTALEAVSAGIGWERAKYLALVYDEDNTLVGQHEQALVAHEAANAVNISTPPPPSWEGQGSEWSSNGKGTGKGNPLAD